jgi:hypothetical protein
MVAGMKASVGGIKGIQLGNNKECEQVRGPSCVSAKATQKSSRTDLEAVAAPVFIIEV